MTKVIKKTHKRLLQAIAGTLSLILAMFAVGDGTKLKEDSKNFTLIDRANADTSYPREGDSGGDHGDCTCSCGGSGPANGI